MWYYAGPLYTSLNECFKYCHTCAYYPFYNGYVCRDAQKRMMKYILIISCVVVGLSLIAGLVALCCVKSRRAARQCPDETNDVTGVVTGDAMQIILPNGERVNVVGYYGNTMVVDPV